MDGDGAQSKVRPTERQFMMNVVHIEGNQYALKDDEAALSTIVNDQGGQRGSNEEFYPNNRCW